MRRTTLLLTMIALVIAGALGMGGWWLRHSPSLPAGHERITPGMTLGEIERLLGQPLTAYESCTRGAYFLRVEEPLAGQIVYLDVSTHRHRYDQATDSYKSLERDDQPCTEVHTERFSRIHWLNEYTWSRWLLELPPHT